MISNTISARAVFVQGSIADGSLSWTHYPVIAWEPTTWTAYVLMPGDGVQSVQSVKDVEVYRGEYLGTYEVSQDEEEARNQIADHVVRIHMARQKCQRGREAPQRYVDLLRAAPDVPGP